MSQEREKIFKLNFSRISGSNSSLFNLPSQQLIKTVPNFFIFNLDQCKTSQQQRNKIALASSTSFIIHLFNIFEEKKVIFLTCSLNTFHKQIRDNKLFEWFRGLCFFFDESLRQLKTWFAILRWCSGKRNEFGPYCDLQKALKLFIHWNGFLVEVIKLVQGDFVWLIASGASTNLLCK